MVLIAAAIRVDSPGPALFPQKRIGHAGHPITVYKFRTMNVVEAVADRASLVTAAGDIRITREGRLLQRWRFDELPQIINILRWEMSWIGPQANLLSGWYVDEVPFHRYRHVVKPGISGWAKVNQGLLPT